jgi:hypothetical protein
MCVDFHVPRHARLDTVALARLSNEMIYKITKDMYSQATVKQARRLAIRAGLVESTTQRVVRRVVAWFKYMGKPTRTVQPKGAFNA